MARAMRHIAIVVGLGIGTWLGACGSELDLPAGWEEADKIDKLTQSSCGERTRNAPPEAVKWEATGGALHLDYEHAQFRCEQPVEGFLRRKGRAVDVLVQPIDMNPDPPVRCDCRYDISIELGLSKGEYTLGLYKRSDNVNMPNPALEVDTTEITIP